MSLFISEYEVQKESKVLDKLEDLPNFSEYVSKDNKKNQYYKFWTRPTISWKLECDDKTPRVSVVKAADFERDKEPMNEGMVIGLSVTAFTVGFIVSLGFLILFCCGVLERT